MLPDLVGADTANVQDDDQQPPPPAQHHQHPHPQSQRGRLLAKGKLSPELQIPKNRSTGNLPAVAESDSDTADDRKPKFRFSFDAGAASVEPDSANRYVLSLTMNDNTQHSTSTTRATTTTTTTTKGSHHNVIIWVGQVRCVHISHSFTVIHSLIRSLAHCLVFRNASHARHYPAPASLPAYVWSARMSTQTTTATTTYIQIPQPLYDGQPYG